MKQYLSTSYVSAARSLLAGGYTAPEIAESLVRQLTKRKALQMLPEIVQGLSELKGIEDVPNIIVTTAKPLTETSRDSILSLVKKKFGAKAQVTERIQKDLLGGFSLQHEDDVTDYSLSSLLQNLKSFIQHTPV